MSFYAVIESRQGDDTGPCIYALYDSREEAVQDADFLRIESASRGRKDVFQLARVEVEG